MKRSALITPVVLLSLTGSLQAADLKTLEERASYAFGQEVFSNLKRQGVSLDPDTFVKGYLDAANGNKPALTPQDASAARMEFQEQLRAKLLEEQKIVGEKNLKEGDAFLKANAEKEGVIVTKSGLQYKVLKSGDGKQATVNDTVVTHYRGTLIDGREFDSSYKRNKPATFPVRGVIAGWTEALQLMKVGDKWELYIPSNLAYGEAQRSELITPNSTLIFEIELLEVK